MPIASPKRPTNCDDRRDPMNVAAHRNGRKTMKTPITRRTFVGGVAGAAGVAAFGGPSFAQLALPKEPVALNIIDVAGNLALTQKAIENYRKAKPNLVSRITFTKAPAPELAGQDQGAAGCRPRRHRPRADRHGRAVGRHRPEAVGRSARRTTRLRCRSSTTSICRPPRKMQALAERAGRRRHLLSVRPAARIHARQGEDAADDRRGTARLGQGQSRTA